MSNREERSTDLECQLAAVREALGAALQSIENAGGEGWPVVRRGRAALSAEAECPHADFTNRAVRALTKLWIEVTAEAFRQQADGKEMDEALLAAARNASNIMYEAREGHPFVLAGPPKEERK